jgi:hypothetical protein
MQFQNKVVLLIFFIHCLCKVSLSAQTTPNQYFYFAPVWDIGKQLNYSFSRSEFSEKGKPDFIVKSTGAFTVLEKTDSSFVLDCKFTCQNKLQTESPKLIYYINGLSVKIQTALDGSFVQILNVNEIRKAAEIFLSTEKNSKVGGADKYIINEVLIKLSNDNFITEALLQDLRLLFIFNGYNFQLDKKEIVQRRVENFINNKMISKTDSYKLVKIDSAKNAATLKVESKCDNAQIKAIILPFLENMAKEFDEPLPREARTDTYTFGDEGIAEVDLKKRIIDSFSYTRTLNSKMFYQGVKIEIKRLKD